MWDGHLLHLNLAIFRIHDRKSDFLVKTQPSAASGIKPEYPR